MTVERFSSLSCSVVASLLVGCGASQEPTASFSPSVEVDERLQAEGGEASSAEEAPEERRPVMIKIAGLDVHRAAPFLAEVFRVNLIVVGGSAERRLDLELTASEPREALSALARAAGLELGEWGEGFVIGPADRIAAVPRTPTEPVGRRIDVRLCRANGREAVRLFGEVLDVEVRGPLRGQITMLTRNVGTRVLLNAVLALAGVEVAPSAESLTLPSQAALPAIEGSDERQEPEDGDELDDLEADRPLIRLEDLEVRAISLSPGREPAALLLDRGNPGWWRCGERVRIGDGFDVTSQTEPSRGWARVTSIEQRGVSIEPLPLAPGEERPQPRWLPLSPPASEGATAQER